MKKINYRLPLIFVGGLLFRFLFWDEFLGINLLLYTLFIIAITFTDKDIPYHKNKLYTALPHLAIAIYIAYNNSALAVTTWFITLLVYLGTAHFTILKSTATALIWGTLQAISGPYGIVTELQTTKLGKINFKPVVKPLKYIVVPLLMVVIFCSLYSIANPIFDEYTRLITDNIAHFFNTIFNFLFVDISIQKCLFILLGILITAGIIVSIKSKLLAEIELGENDQLIRKRRDKRHTWLFQDFRTLLAGSQIKKKLALKTENIIGIISLVALNLLLFMLNSIDLFTLWFGNNTSKNFSAELHDGTNTLIFSIIIAMLVIVYFFSGNLNFYSKNKSIKALAYLWIAQNAFLVFSVFHRDYDYIFYHGLTYKRIGVVVFATLSLIGLATVYIKVARQKTMFYLYRINSKIWYALLVLLSFANWDALIIKYNVNNADKIGLDTNYLLNLSAKNLPLLIQHKTVLIAERAKKNEQQSLDNQKDEPSGNTKKQQKVVFSAKELKEMALLSANYNINKALKDKADKLQEKYTQCSWLSYSYLEWKACQFAKTVK